MTQTETLGPQVWGDHGVAIYQRLMLDRENRAAAFSWALANEDRDSAARLVASWAEVGVVSWVGEPAGWLEAVVPFFPGLSPSVAADLLYACACYRHFTGGLPRPDQAAEARRLRQVMREIGDERRAAQCLMAEMVFDKASAALAEVPGTAALIDDHHLAMTLHVAAANAVRYTGATAELDYVQLAGAHAAAGGPLLLYMLENAYGLESPSLEQREARLQHLLASEVTGIPVLYRHVLRGLAFTAASRRNFPEVRRIVAEVLPGFMEHGDRNCVGISHLLSSAAADHDGDRDEAFRLHHSAVECLRTTPMWAAAGPILGARLVALHLRWGDRRNAEAATDAIRKLESTGNTRAALGLAEAMLHLEAGDPSRAEAAFAPALREGHGRLSPAVQALRLASVASSAKGDHLLASRILGALESTTSLDWLPWSHVDRLVASVRDEARCTLGEAAYEEAVAEGRKMGLREVLFQTRRDRPRRPVSGWASLTRAERQVVDLVAQGLSNGDIAERLYVSVRTVTTHLTRVYTKLGLSSRPELVASAARRDR